MVTMVTIELNALERRSGAKQHFQNADVSIKILLMFENQKMTEMFRLCASKTTRLVLHYNAQRSLNRELHFFEPMQILPLKSLFHYLVLSYLGP